MQDCKEDQVTGEKIVIPGSTNKKEKDKKRQEDKREKMGRISGDAIQRSFSEKRQYRSNRICDRISGISILVHE